MKNFILLGAPGSGKGTQSDKLKKKFNLYHISTGDILRDYKSSLSNEQQEAMNKGGLVSDDLIFELLVKVIAIEKNNNYDGFIFDGFPRTQKQAEKLFQEILNNPEDQNFVIEYQISDELVTERILNRAKQDEEQGKMVREDDKNVQTIQNRLATFHKNIDEIMPIFKEKNEQNLVSLFTINIESLKVDEIFNETSDFVEQKTKSKFSFVGQLKTNREGLKSQERQRLQ